MNFGFFFFAGLGELLEDHDTAREKNGTPGVIWLRLN
jgi:hypothetical protein